MLSEHDRTHRPQPRNIESLLPEEQDQFLAVFGWRIWIISIFSGKEYKRPVQAAVKPLAIMIRPDRFGYQVVWDRYEENQPAKTPKSFRGPDIPDRPSFLLEPLTEKEVQKLDEQGKVSVLNGSRQNGLLKPEDLRKILDRQNKFRKI